jgi:hypothetical protein
MRTNSNNTEQIDPEEMEDIIQDASQESNPNMHVPNDPVEQQEAPEESIRRLTRDTRPIEWLEPKMSGKSYMQEQKKVNFKCDANLEL